MKAKFLVAILMFISVSAVAQTDSTAKKKPDPNKKILNVKVGCGQCKFDMSGNGCDLAVRYKGKSYFITGTTIDDHGDAHAEDGFCKAIGKAKVQGEVIDGKFMVTYFELVPEKGK